MPALYRLLAIALAFLAGVATADDPDPMGPARQEFLAAYARASATPPQPDLASDSDLLRSYPLYPYLQAVRLENRLADPAAAAEIGAFLQQHGSAPYARTLRGTWLMTLAQRRDWEPYLAAYREDVDSTVAARCNALAARVALGRTDGLAEAVTRAYLSPKSVPAACDPAFDWLRAQGGLTPALIEQRARLALGAGDASLARFLAKSLPAAQAAPLEQWAALIEKPRPSVEALIAEPARPVEPVALLDGWSRFSRSDAQAAADLYPSLVQARALDAAAASPFALATAQALSWSRLPRSLEFFALGAPADFDERAHEWHVRAALWAGDWPRAAKAIAAMPEALRNQNRWRYWAARTAELLGDKRAARAGYEAVLPTDNWYAALSAARLGRSYAPTPIPMARDEAVLAAVSAELPMVRTRELILCAMQPEANAEWRAALDRYTPAQQTQAVRIAMGWGWYMQGIAAAAKLGQFNDYDLLYPRPYDADVRRGAQLSGLPTNLIYAIIRQESLFRADAASSAGALGLMQLLPATAKTTARRNGLPEPTRTSLLQPSVNVPLGSLFLSNLIDRADGQWPLAIAGYNAGPAAARRWLAATPVAADVWVENIPFNETRAYVQRVHWHSLVFDWLGDRKPRDTSGWLGAVRSPADPAAAPAAN
jgi:soluble lytic murein transglycosylase